MTSSESAQAKLEAVRQKCVEANPDKDCPLESSRNHCVAHAIRLADVLLALQPIARKVETDFSSVDGLSLHSTSGSSTWNLRKGYLDEQSPETIDFLHSLLS